MTIIIIITRLPVTRWVKLSLYFELLVKRVMEILLGQRLFNNNIFLYNLNYSVSKKQPRKLNKRKEKKFIQENEIQLKINSMVSKLLTFIIGRLSPWIFESTHGLKQTSKTTRVL